MNIEITPKVRFIEAFALHIAVIPTNHKGHWPVFPFTSYYHTLF